MVVALLIACYCMVAIFDEVINIMQWFGLHLHLIFVHEVHHTFVKYFFITKTILFKKIPCFIVDEVYDF